MNAPVHKRTIPSNLAAWVTLCCAAFAISGSAAADTLPDDVRSALESNEQGLLILTVAWREDFRTSLPVKTLLERAGMKRGHSAFLLPREYRYERNGEKFFYYYKEYRQVPPEPTYVDRHEWAFDGTFLYESAKAAASDSPDAEEYTPLLTIRKMASVAGDDRTKDTPYVKCLYLDAAGYHVPQYGKELPRPPTSLILQLVDSGAEVVSVRQETLETRHCTRVVLRTTALTYVFFLDPQKRYATVQYDEMTTSGKPVVTVKNSEFLELTDPTVWLPRQAHMVWYAWHDLYNWKPPLDRLSRQPVLSIEITVADLQQQYVADKRFVFSVEDAEPGTLVGDERLPGAKATKYGRVSYVVPADKSMLDAAIQRAIERPIKVRSVSRWRLVLVLANAALVALLLLIWTVRRVRRHTC